jgi:membrane-bound ClpP family serine protease
MGKDTVNKLLYAGSAVVALISAIFLSLLFLGKSSYSLSIPPICLVLLFSPLGKKLHYIRVFTVVTLSIIASMLVGLAIPLNIGRYFDNRGALAPDWLHPFYIFCLVASIILGLVLAYIIFKKYYKKQQNEEKI